MDDYVYLEDMGRKVAEWGREIAHGGYAVSATNASGRGKRGRGRGRGRGLRGTQGGKRDILRTQLELRDIDMDMLPLGMHRRTQNASTWDFRYISFSSSSAALILLQE